jgi:hypothetical protein
MNDIRIEIDWRVPAAQAWKGSEHDLQREVVTRAMALVQMFPHVMDLHAIPNGDWRGWKTASKLKAEGVLPGVPDLFLPVPRGHWHGFYIELKSAKGAVSKEQWGFLERRHQQGYLARIYNHPILAVDGIATYLKL